jgi:hypothetical protein
MGVRKGETVQLESEGVGKSRTTHLSGGRLENKENT